MEPERNTHLLALIKTLVEPPPQDEYSSVAAIKDELEPYYSVQLNEGMKSAIRGGFMEVVKVLVVGFPELKVSFDV